MPPGCRRCGSKFLYVFKAALDGPHAPPPGRVPAAAAVALRPSRLMPDGWRGERGARGRRRREGLGKWWGVRRRQPAAPRRSDAAQGRARRVRAGGSRRRSGRGYCASGGGAPAPGWPGLRGRVAVRGWLRGPSRQPTTRASRADHHPTRQRPTVRHGRLDMAGRAAARSPGGGSTADGMATTTSAGVVATYSL